MQIFKRRNKKTERILENTKMDKVNKKQNRAMLAKLGIEFFKHILVKAKAIELNEREKITNFDPKMVATVVQGLKNRLTKLIPTPTMMDQCMDDMNLVLVLGKMAKSVLARKKLPAKMINFDPKQPDYLLPE